MGVWEGMGRQTGVLRSSRPGTYAVCCYCLLFCNEILIIPGPLTLIPHPLIEVNSGRPHQFNVRITGEEDSLAGLEMLPKWVFLFHPSPGWETL